MAKKKSELQREIDETTKREGLERYITEDGDVAWRGAGHRGTPGAVKGYGENGNLAQMEKVRNENARENRHRARIHQNMLRIGITRANWPGSQVPWNRPIK